MLMRRTSHKENGMNRILTLIAAGGVALSVAGCQTDNPNDRALGGAVIGGVGGAAVGAAVSNHHPGRGALIGGAIGAVGGAAVGAATTPTRDPRYDDGYGGGERQCARTGYDTYGNRVCVAYY
jgi:Glycine zipper